MLKFRSTILVLVLLAVVISACGPKTNLNKLELAPLSALPEDKQAAPQTVQEAYRFALANPDILSKIPCYCGCGEGHGEEIPHQSVKECFVREIWPDGTVIWDDMGLGWSICVDIVRDTMRLMIDENKTLAETRTYIDDTYSQYGEGTDTEPVVP